MEIQFITDAQGNRTAAIIPFDEWERTEKAKDILEHVGYQLKAGHFPPFWLYCNSTIKQNLRSC